MKFRLEDMVQRKFNYAIVDEVDSILVDEARTPLIISGPSTDGSEMYIAMDAVIPRLVAEDYEKDEKQRTVSLTEQGQEHIEQLLQEVGLLKVGGLYDVRQSRQRAHTRQPALARPQNVPERRRICGDGQQGEDCG